MRIQFLIVIIIFSLSLFSDWYVWQALRKRFKSKLPSRIQLWSAIALYILAIVAILLPRNSGSDAVLVDIMWMLFIFSTFFIAKLIFTVVDIFSTIPLLWRKKRWKGVTIAATLLAVVVFASLWWGALFNRYQIQLRELTVEIPGLASSMNGLRIVQISDFHLGTYGNNPAFVAKVVGEIERLHPDAVFFTGDIVNRRSDEMIPFIGALSTLKAPMGVYAILGNHDYGDYSSWPTPKAKSDNMELLYDSYKKTGWRLLRNETAWLTRGRDSLAVIGVENIGDPPFPVYGNLKRAYPTLSDTLPKILLSHNPAHWQSEVCDKPDINIGLTLAGHTHAMQIEILGLSPAAFRYPTWGGYYIDPSKQHPLYVNIGLGTVGFPSRVGATPEITLITLISK